jgi:hypothetical protein
MIIKEPKIRNDGQPVDKASFSVAATSAVNALLVLIPTFALIMWQVEESFIWIVYLIYCIYIGIWCEILCMKLAGETNQNTYIAGAHLITLTILLLSFKFAAPCFLSVIGGVIIFSVYHPTSKSPLVVHIRVFIAICGLIYFFLSMLPVLERGSFTENILFAGISMFVALYGIMVIRKWRYFGVDFVQEYMIKKL